MTIDQAAMELAQLEDTLKSPVSSAMSTPTSSAPSSRRGSMVSPPQQMTQKEQMMVMMRVVSEAYLTMTSWSIQFVQLRRTNDGVTIVVSEQWICTRTICTQVHQPGCNAHCTLTILRGAGLCYLHQCSVHAPFAERSRGSAEHCFAHCLAAWICTHAH